MFDALIITILAFSPPISDTPCDLRIVAAATTASVPWVKLANTCADTIDLSEHVLRWSDEFDYARGADWLEGKLAPGECIVVGDFSPPLHQNANCSIGFALFNPFVDIFTSAPSQAVTYGGPNCGGLDWLDAAWSDVDAPAPTDHIALTEDGWDVLPGAAPPKCAHSNLPPPVFRIPPPDCLLAIHDGAMCETHPFGPAIECGPEEEPQTTEKCEIVLDLNFEICSSDYVACREDMRLADCGVCPASCAGIVGACTESTGGDPAGGGLPIAAPAPAAEDCLELSEVFVQPASTAPAGQQWVRVRNTCARPVETDGIQLRWTFRHGWAAGGTIDLGDLGEIDGGECVTIGGTVSSVHNYQPSFDLAAEMTPPMQVGLVSAEGVGLFSGDAAFASVVYGAENLLGIVGESGGPETSVGYLPPGHSLWRTGGIWYDSDHPSPHSCQAF